MKKLLYAIILLFQVQLLSSCSFMEGMAAGMVGFMGGGVYGTDPAVGMYGSSVPSSWGNGYAGPMLYSNDPVVNSTVGVAQTEARLSSQGISTKTSTSNTTRSSGSKDDGWYKCCADVPNFGIVTYHVCPNCGQKHIKGSGHMCKKH